MKLADLAQICGMRRAADPYENGQTRLRGTGKLWRIQRPVS